MTTLNTTSQQCEQSQSSSCTEGFPVSPKRDPASLFKPAKLYGMLPLHEGKVGISFQTEDKENHRFVICQIDAEQSLGMRTLRTPASMLALDEIRQNVEKLKEAYCPEKWVENQKMLAKDPDYANRQELAGGYQKNYGIRVGGQKACDSILRKITKIEQAHYGPELQKPRTTHSTHQSALAHQCCTTSHNHENPEGHEHADQSQDCMCQCAQKP